MCKYRMAHKNIIEDLEIGYLLNLVNIFQLNVSFVKVQNMFVK